MTSLSSAAGLGYAGSFSRSSSLPSAIDPHDGDRSAAPAAGARSQAAASGSLTADEAAILSTLSDGAYGAGNMPDFAAVVTGPDVSPQFDGGYNVVAIYSQYGSVQLYGGTLEGSTANGSPTGPVNAKAAVVHYGPGDSAADRQSLVTTALGYLR